MYLSRRRPGHPQALLEVEERHEDDMRRLWLRKDEEGVRKDAESHFQQRVCTQSGRAVTRTAEGPARAPPPLSPQHLTSMPPGHSAHDKGPPAVFQAHQI